MAESYTVVSWHDERVSMVIKVKVKMERRVAAGTGREAQTFGPIVGKSLMKDSTKKPRYNCS